MGCCILGGESASCMLMMVGLICTRCQVALHPADSAVEYLLHVVHMALSICCLTCTGCMKLTNANTMKIAFAIWCMQLMMLVSSTVHCEATATWRVPKLYISTTQGMLPQVYLCIPHLYSVAIPRPQAQLHIVQSLS